MTKQQKARAHLARAQELIQDTLGFGVKEVTHTGGQDEGAKPLPLTRLSVDSIFKTISNLNGESLLMLLNVRNHKLTTMINEFLATKSNETNLMNAFESKDYVMVNLLLRRGAPMTSLELLREAIERGLTSLATKIIISRLSTSTINTNKIHIDHKITEYGGQFTPLMFAIHRANYDIAEVLVDEGANVNATLDKDGRQPHIIRTPLDLACWRVINFEDHDGFVRYLLQHGAEKSMMGKFRYLLNEDEMQDFPENERDLGKLIRSYSGIRASTA